MSNAPILQEAEGILMGFAHGNETPSVYHLHLLLDTSTRRKKSTFSTTITQYCGNRTLLRLGALLQMTAAQKRKPRITVVYADDANEGRRVYLIKASGLRGPLQAWEIALTPLPQAAPPGAATTPTPAKG